MQKKANHLAAAVFSALMLTAAIGAPAVSAEHYNVYNYDCWGEAVPAQAGYAAQRAVSGQDLGCGAFNTPSDLFRDWEDRFYIADSGNNRIVVTDGDFSKATRIYDKLKTEDGETTLNYGSADYTRINPAMDEHGEINLLLFDGLTAHDGENNVVPGLAETWELDEATNTYTFHLRENLTWHDGEPVTASDVKFTIEAIMDPENGSENAPNFEDVEEITVTDEHTVSFRLSAPNVAFLDYMTMAILPEHLLASEDWQESDFFRRINSRFKVEKS